ncbi:hypothetical protein [Pimelobacter simplex]|uniref:hypothetical protein n=1 Tax=Nocardioides simplex TaxID=2045 RepID=UPI003AAC792A
MSQPHSLTWGDIRLAGDTVDPDAEFVIEAMADGTKLGTAKQLVEFVKSLQVDGSLAVMNGHDNAETVLQLRVSAPDGMAAGPAAAKAAAALAANASADPIPPLVWVSPLEDAATCVYDVYAADPERDEGNDWDLDEEVQECRYFTVTMSRHPFSRPPDPVTVPALPVPPASETKTVIDTCDSASGWTVPTAYGFGTVQRTNEILNPSPVQGIGQWTADPGTDVVAVQAASVTPPMDHTWVDILGTAFQLRPITGVANRRMLAEAVQGSSAHVVAPGDRIYLRNEIAVRVTATGGGGAVKDGSTIKLVVDQWNGATSSGQTEIGNLVAIAGAADANGWVYKTIHGYYTVPAGTTRIRLALVHAYAPVAGEKIYASNFMLERVPAGAVGARSFLMGTNINGATSYSGWTGTPYNSTTAEVAKPSPTSAGGSVIASGTPVSVYGPRSLELRRTGATAAPGALPYLRISAAASVAGVATDPTFKRGLGTLSPITPIAVMPSLVSGYLDYYFTAADFDRLSVSLAAPAQPATPSASIAVAEVAHTNLIVSSSTNRQRSRAATILGSAPTQAAIRLYDSTTPTPGALGTDILVYSTKNAALAPPMRPFLTSGGATVDTAMISGARNTLAAPAVFRIQAAKLRDGMHGLVGRLNVTTAGTLTWSTRIVDSAGAATIGSGVTDSGSIEVPVTSGYRAINLAAMLLPPVEVEGSQLVEITIAGTANMSWDEFWLFNLTEGSLTWVRDADSMTWIEIRPAELGKLPSIYGGTGAFGTNPVCVDYKTIGTDFGAADQHYADPGPLQVFAVTSTSLKAQSELWFYPRYLDAVIDEAA